MFPRPSYAVRGGDHTSRGLHVRLCGRYDHDSMVTLIKGATELNMVVVTQAALVAVDWGTSSFRAWLVTARGQVVFLSSSLSAGLEVMQWILSD